MSSLLEKLEKLGIPKVKIYRKGEKLEEELIKYTNIDSVKVVAVPEDLYQPDKTKIEENEVYRNTINSFGKIIRDLIPEEHLGNFYKNFGNIQMTELTKSQIYSEILKGGKINLGAYDPETNTIYVKNSLLSNLLGVLTFHLLQAASTYYDPERQIIYRGISQSFINSEDRNKSETYGIALNSGYTQYLNNKYFIDPKSITINNKTIPLEEGNPLPEKAFMAKEQILAQALVAIFGEDMMNSFYFRSDFYGLVKELEKYQSREAIYRFINYTDVLYMYSSEENVKNEIIDEVKKFVNSFLVGTFLKVQKEKGIDDKQAAIDFLNKCLPYSQSGTDTHIVETRYLSGEKTNPLEGKNLKK